MKFLFRRRELLTALAASLVLAPKSIAAVAPRRLALKNQNTGESFAGPYRDKYGPIPDAMEDLAEFLRDHHANKIGPVDVGAIDFLADVMDAAGQTRATVLSGFRTPATNAKLAALGAVERSLHLRGLAVDVTFDARLKDAMLAARQMKRGGVGWYPRSHFLHLDSGPVRNWDLDGKGFDTVLVGGSAPTRGKVTVLRGAKATPTVAERMAIHRDLARRQFLLRQGK